MPKSGTNWIAQLLEEVPGYRQRLIRDRDRCMRSHDICDAAIKSLPRGLYSVMRTHTRCTPDNVAVLERHRLKTVVMHRDLRDQAVSRMYHIWNDPRHHMYDAYRSMSSEEALADSIETAAESYVPWVTGWLDQIEHDPDRFHELRYEDLHENPVHALRGVLDFYEVPTGDQAVEAMFERVRGRTTFGLEDGRLLTGAGTARKGAVGDWRTHFTPEHVELFKRRAGDLLIRLGQEKDMDWSVGRVGV
jgi:hypothetical protein